VCVAENVSQPLVLWDTEEKRLLTVRR